MLKSLKKNRKCVCDKRAKGHKRSSSLRTEEVTRAAQKTIEKKSKKKRATFSTTDWGLNQHCMENQS
jgi:hypothetical protein